MAKFINTQKSWDGSRIVEEGEEVEKISGDSIPHYLEPVDDEAKALKEEYESMITEALLDDATPKNEEDEAKNPYKALQNKNAVLEEVCKRGIIPPASATRTQLEELLIADDNAKKADEVAKIQVKAIADAEVAAKFEAIKGVAELFDIPVEDSDTVESLQEKIAEKKESLSKTAPQEEKEEDKTGTGTGEVE